MSKKNRADVERIRNRIRAEKESAPKKIMVVSNRTDRDLQRALAKKLDATIVWVVGDKPRRLKSAAKAISNGRFASLILFTGFLDHKAVLVMVDAARKSETPIVRANRGRLAAVEKAMERDLKGETDDADDDGDKERPGQDGVG